MPLFSRLDDDSKLHKVTVTKSKHMCCCQASVTEVDESVAKLRQKSRAEQSSSDEAVIKIKLGETARKVIK